MLEVGQILTLEIKRLGINGEGIAFYKRLAIFIKNAIPSELCKVEILTVSNKMATGKVVEYIKSSSDRVLPLCQYCDRCDGCQISHIKYESTGKFKRDAVIEALNRYTDINTRSFEIKPTIQLESPYGYRYKSSLPVRKFNDKSTVGLYNSESKELVYINTCLVQNEIINRVNSEILKYVDELNVTPYVEKYRRGELKYIVCRVSHYNNEVQVTLITHSKTPKIFELAKKVINIDNVVSVYESLNDSLKDGIIFGPSIKLLEGKKTIIESIGNYKFELLPNAFFQLNPVQTEKMYEVIKKACKLSMKEKVLDAYCGVGTIGIYLSKLAKEVIGIEYNKEAVENANNNAKLNKVRNAKFYQGDVTELLPKMIADGTKFDVIVVDPPRTGLGVELCQTLLNNDVSKIIYISCNPASLAKDLNLLIKKYNINSIQPIDMFPMTSHVETIVLLCLKDAKK